MKKMLVTVGVLGGLVVLAKRLGSRMPKVDWEQRIAAMPDDAPPKWMFNNITAIRENTERILELVGTAPFGGMRVDAAREAERSQSAADLRELEVEHDYGVVTEVEFQAEERRLHP